MRLRFAVRRLANIDNSNTMSRMNHAVSTQQQHDVNHGVTLWPSVLGKIGKHQELNSDDVAFAMNSIMSGEASDVQAASFAFGLFAKGITPTELETAATIMLSFARDVADPEVIDAVARGGIDIVGTGGDGAHTVNISTMSAVVVAAAGIPVIKHGNRAASSKSGGADMLEALGLDLEQGSITAPQRPDFFLKFLFAAAYHPAMRFAAPFRKELQVPTLFNLLGPVTNPAQPSAALVGCAFADQLETMAGAFAQRRQRALIVRGYDGLDEITVADKTDCFAVADGAVLRFDIDPQRLGFELSDADSLRGGDPVFNAEIARQLWSGQLTGPVRDAVVLNAGAAIAVGRGWGSKLTESAIYAALTKGVAEAEQIIASGLCLEIVESALKH